MADPTPPKTLQSIHFLRGLASLFVVLIHALGSVTLKFPGHQSVLPRSFQDYLYLCASSVDFFFLISGISVFQRLKKTLYGARDLIFPKII